MDEIRPRLARENDANLSQAITVSASTGKDLKLVGIVDSHTLTRDCLEICLRAHCEWAAVLSFVDMTGLLGAGIDASKLALVLYSIHDRLVSDQEVEQGLSEAKQAFPSVPIVLLTDDERADQIVEALDRGARGYVPAHASLDILVGATHVVLAGGTFVPATSLINARPSEPTNSLRADRFTPRQLEVLECVRRGKANRTIARELEMSESTVKAHVCNLMRKLKATNRTQLVYLTKDLFTAEESTRLPMLTGVDDAFVGAA
jgi:DNA-binding NarL/FixJ family response regulator